MSDIGGRPPSRNARPLPPPGGNKAPVQPPAPKTEPESQKPDEPAAKTAPAETRIAEAEPKIATLEGAMRDLEAANKQRDDADAAKARAEESLAQARQKIAELEQRLHKAAQDASAGVDAQNALDAIKTKLDAVGVGEANADPVDRIQALSEACKRDVVLLPNERTKLEGLEQENTQLEAKIGQLEATASATQTELVDLHQTKAQLEGQVAELKKNLQSAKDRETNLVSQIALLQKEHDDLRTECESAKRGLDKISNQWRDHAVGTTLADRITNVYDNLANAIQKWTEAHAKVKKLEGEISQYEQDLNERDQQIAQLTQDLADERSQSMTTGTSGGSGTSGSGTGTGSASGSTGTGSGGAGTGTSGGSTGTGSGGAAGSGGSGRSAGTGGSGGAANGNPLVHKAKAWFAKNWLPLAVIVVLLGAAGYFAGGKLLGMIGGEEPKTAETNAATTATATTPEPTATATASASEAPSPPPAETLECFPANQANIRAYMYQDVSPNAVVGHVNTSDTSRIHVSCSQPGLPVWKATTGTSDITGCQICLPAGYHTGEAYRMTDASVKALTGQNSASCFVFPHVWNFWTFNGPFMSFDKDCTHSPERYSATQKCHNISGCTLTLPKPDTGSGR